MQADDYEVIVVSVRRALKPDVFGDVEAVHVAISEVLSHGHVSYFTISVV